jgi:hypothetical protein
MGVREGRDIDRRERRRGTDREDVIMYHLSGDADSGLEEGRGEAQKISSGQSTLGVRRAGFV